MPIFEQLRQEAAQRNLQFLVVGGHAVNAHGYVRATDDVDILICKEDRACWEELIRALGYVIEHDGGTFLQLKPGREADWNLDLMLVNAETFHKLLGEAKHIELERTPVVVPSLDHLLALKLHALKHGHSRRFLKDLDDVVKLVEMNRIDVKIGSFREMCEKHANADIYEKIIRLCA